MTNNDDLKREGRADRAGANVKDAADSVGDAVDKVKDKVTDR